MLLTHCFRINSIYFNLFWLHYSDCYAADDCLRYVFGPRYAAVNAIYSQFRVDCLTLAVYVVLFIVLLFSYIVFNLSVVFDEQTCSLIVKYDAVATIPAHHASHLKRVLRLAAGQCPTHRALEAINFFPITLPNFKRFQTILSKQTQQ